MDGMTVTKLQIDLAKNLSKAGEVARFLDSAPGKGLRSPLLRNLWSIAHASAHVGFRCLARMSEELLEAAADAQAPLFDTPEDHAMTVAEIERWIDGFKSVILGDYQHDDTGRGDFEPQEPVGGFAGRVKSLIFQHGTEGIAPGEVVMVFEGDEGVPEGGVASVVHALIHTGEIFVIESEQEGAADALVAESGNLSLDIMAMLAAQPGLGTEEGIGEDEITVIPIAADPADGEEPPELVDAISVKIFAGDGATRAELYSQFDDETAVERALEWLTDHRKIDAVPDEEGDVSRNSTRFVPYGQDLDALHGDTLRAVYERETGEKAGRKGEQRMRDEIAQRRAAASDEAADPGS